MSNRIKVSVPKMQNKGDSIKNAIVESMQSIKELENSISALNTNWEGIAWEAYKRQFYDDIQYIYETYNMLYRYLDELSTAEQTYADCDNQNFNELKNVRI
ncbi:MAG: WXG100 family type VII secretion target [Eubacterium sp.]|nr:WXG100 family type VII secretion target [Eubacterium sp.]